MLKFPFTISKLYSNLNILPPARVLSLIHHSSPSSPFCSTSFFTVFTTGNKGCRLPIQSVGQLSLRHYHQAAALKAARMTPSSFLRELLGSGSSSGSSAPSAKMASESFPVKKSEQEWQAVLTPGWFRFSFLFFFFIQSVSYLIWFCSCLLSNMCTPLYVLSHQALFSVILTHPITA